MSGFIIYLIKKNLHLTGMRFLVLGVLLLSGVVLTAQTVNVRGKVTDSASGMGIPGANVLVKGTTMGTVTDIDGGFALDVPVNGTLVVSFIGFRIEQVNVEGRSEINFSLQAETIGLDEVVAIGYGTVKKRDLTGAVASVRSEEIKMAPVANPVEALHGRVAGLDITRQSGKADAGSSILLRGNRSLTASSEPIYIIDGIQGSIRNLNPNDIASVEVLKDASSTAIYGSAGANGVLIVTTKQAEKGKIQVDFDSYVNINGWASYPSALQGDAWLDYLEEAFYATNGVRPSSRDELLTAWSLDATILNNYINQNKWVDWVDATLKTGIQQNYAVSLRGGTNSVRSSLSLGYNRTDGIYMNDYSDKITMRGSVNIEAARWFNAGIQTGLTFRDGESRGSRINKTFGTVPLGDVYDAEGNIKQEPIDGMTVISLIADDIEGTLKNNNKLIAITANPFLEILLHKNLTFKSILGTSLSTSRSGVFNSDHTYMMLVGSQTPIRNGSYGMSLGYGYTWENIANYHLQLGEIHDFTTTLITSWSHYQNESGSAYNENFLYDDFLFYNLDAGTNPAVSSGYNHKKMMSYAGRLNYSHRGKYMLTGSVRYDGASQLANHWDVFPAGAVAWRISEEKFLEGTKNWLDNLKLRAGYGVTGNSNINPYVTKSEVTSGSDMLNLGAGEVSTNIPTQATGNASLGWEKSYNLNIGLDFNLFRSRIEGSVDWYDTDTRDVIYARSLPFSGGGYTAKLPYQMNANIARMHNKGIEVTLNTRNVQTRNFVWTSTVTFSRNWEEVTSIDLGSATTVDNLISLGLFMGSPKNTVYGYKKLGIWQKGEESDAAVFGLKPGDVKIESCLKKQSDGVWIRSFVNAAGRDTVIEYSAANPYTINATNDRQILGQGTPKWMAGFQNTFTYRNFDLNIFATARYGQMISGQLLGYFGYQNINMPDNYDYWTEDNPTNDFPRPYLSRSPKYSSPTEALSYADASYIKIKNITLGYTIPRVIGNKIGLANLRIYGTVYDPFIFAKSHLLKGVDPETGATDSFPLYKQLVFGVNVSF